jgi:tripartite-type tricarboxylate transporter receptor subunit TctC
MVLGSSCRRVIAGVLTLLPGSVACAQGAADFYKGKTASIYVGYTVGGGYDLYARVIARHLGRYIAGNPTFVAKNMEGAGSVRLANWLYNAAPKDGSVMGTIGRGAAFEPLLGQKGALFDAAKFTWIGSANSEVSVCVAWSDAGIARFEDLPEKQLIVGATGAGGDTDAFPRVLNAVLGTKLKLVSGYPGGNDVDLAMERGEVKGRCGWSWSSVKSTHPDWIRDHKIKVLVQLGLTKHPDLPDVPLVTEFAKTDAQRQLLRLIFARQVMGRPYLAPPGVPRDRAEMLRNAFAATLHDPDFLADAEKSQIEINPVSGDAIEKLVAEAYQTPAEVVQRAAAMLK